MKKSTTEQKKQPQPSPPPPVEQSKKEKKKDVNYFINGMIVHAKLIGIETEQNLKESTEESAQELIVKLKAQQLAKKESKQKIWIKLNIDGVQINDELTNKTIYSHPLNSISYMTIDKKDTRTLAYIYKDKSTNIYQFFCIKTKEDASFSYKMLNDLFQFIFELKMKAKKMNDKEEDDDDEDDDSDEEDDQTGVDGKEHVDNEMKESSIFYLNSNEKQEDTIKTFTVIDDATNEKPKLTTTVSMTNPEVNIDKSSFNQSKSLDNTLEEMDLLGDFDATPLTTSTSIQPINTTTTNHNDDIAHILETTKLNDDDLFSTETAVSIEDKSKEVIKPTSTNNMDDLFSLDWNQIATSPPPVLSVEPSSISNDLADLSFDSQPFNNENLNDLNGLSFDSQIFPISTPTIENNTTNHDELFKIEPQKQLDSIQTTKNDLIVPLKQTEPPTPTNLPTPTVPTTPAKNPSFLDEDLFSFFGVQKLGKSPSNSSFPIPNKSTTPSTPK
jgi:hypothetical protein